MLDLYRERAMKSRIRPLVRFGPGQKLIFISLVAVVGIASVIYTLASGSPPTLYVDANSIGGQCSDSRTTDQVSLSTPWCSLTKAVSSAPAGSTVNVRQANYPALTVASYAPTLMVSFKGYGSEHPIVA